MPTWGCDWTWRQGALDAAGLEKEGFSYVWLKAGGAQKEGWSFVDPWFQRNANAVLQTGLIPGAYWYLMPGGTGWQQAALLHGMLAQTAAKEDFMVKLDVEQTGLTRDDVFGFLGMWKLLEPRWPMWCYTRRDFWLANNLGTNQGMLLEEAHWVSDHIANDPGISYASQQYKYIDPKWMEVNYAGWVRAHMHQFTGHARIRDKYVPASAYPGTKQDLLRLALPTATWSER